MSEAAWFIAVFGGLFVLRIVAATIVFAVLLPRGDRCPNCDAVTVRVESAFVDLLLPWFQALVSILWVARYAAPRTIESPTRTL